MKNKEKNKENERIIAIMNTDDMDKILDQIGQLDDSDQAEIAARILNDIDPNMTNLLVFINILDATPREELYERLTDHTEKE